jgi:hypothetical protein
MTWIAVPVVAQRPAERSPRPEVERETDEAFRDRGPSGVESIGGEAIEIAIRGKLQTGLMAIGGETTGTTVTAKGITFELELAGRQRRIAEQLDGRRVLVKGELNRRTTPERGQRWIVDVRRIDGLWNLGDEGRPRRPRRGGSPQLRPNGGDNEPIRQRPQAPDQERRRGQTIGDALGRLIDDALRSAR